MKATHLVFPILLGLGCGDSKDPVAPEDCRFVDSPCPTGLICTAAQDGSFLCQRNDEEVVGTPGQSAPVDMTPEPTTTPADQPAGPTSPPEGTPQDAPANMAPDEIPASPEVPAESLPDATMAPSPDDLTMPAGDCSQWPLEATDPVSRLYEQLSSQYRPITVENDLGGNPNRYTTARRRMFSDAERYDAGGGLMVVECVYTGATSPTSENADPPRDDINCEHVMPRSRMAGELAQPALYEHQQSDMHNLMPSVPTVNSARGSFRFGNVIRSRTMHGASAQGQNSNGDTVFEVRLDRRGDIARIMFYFSVRWGIDIANTEEEVLRAWSDDDPVDARERSRNAAIANIQGNRNPFVDCPDLIENITDFRAFDIGNETLPLP